MFQEFKMFHVTFKTKIDIPGHCVSVVFFLYSLCTYIYVCSFICSFTTIFSEGTYLRQIPGVLMSKPRYCATLLSLLRTMILVFKNALDIPLQLSISLCCRNRRRLWLDYLPPILHPIGPSMVGYINDYQTIANNH